MLIAGTFYTQNLQLEDSRIVKFHIWDTSGQERFRSVAPLYYKGAAAAILVYDVTSYVSFTSAKSWIQELATNDDLLIVLVGNKVDLEPSKNTVTFREAETYAQEHGYFHFGTSAKTAKNVKALFYKIAKEVAKPDLLPPDEEPLASLSTGQTATDPLIVHPQDDQHPKRSKVRRFLSSLAILLFCFKRKRRTIAITS